ncbi:MAG: hypothetical protein V1846_04455 [Candidatus Komeilibacteria bacterium]
MRVFVRLPGRGKKFRPQSHRFGGEKGWKFWNSVDDWTLNHLRRIERRWARIVSADTCSDLLPVTINFLPAWTATGVSCGDPNEWDDADNDHFIPV